MMLFELTNLPRLCFSIQCIQRDFERNEARNAHEHSWRRAPVHHRMLSLEPDGQKMWTSSDSSGVWHLCGGCPKKLS